MAEDDDEFKSCVSDDDDQQSQKSAVKALPNAQQLVMIQRMKTKVKVDLKEKLAKNVLAVNVVVSIGQFELLVQEEVSKYDLE